MERAPIPTLTIEHKTGLSGPEVLDQIRRAALRAHAALRTGQPLQRREIRLPVTGPKGHYDLRCVGKEALERLVDYFREEERGEGSGAPRAGKERSGVTSGEGLLRRDQRGSSWGDPNGIEVR